MSLYQPIEQKFPMPLGRWLLSQRQRSDLVGQLADAARRDPRFPTDGDFATISRHLNTVGADVDMHEALEIADLDRVAY